MSSTALLVTYNRDYFSGASSSSVSSSQTAPTDNEKISSTRKWLAWGKAFVPAIIFFAIFLLIVRMFKEEGVLPDFISEELLTGVVTAVEFLINGFANLRNNHRNTQIIEDLNEKQNQRFVDSEYKESLTNTEIKLRAEEIEGKEAIADLLSSQDVSAGKWARLKSYVFSMPSAIAVWLGYQSTTVNPLNLPGGDTSLGLAFKIGYPVLGLVLAAANSAICAYDDKLRHEQEKQIAKLAGDPPDEIISVEEEREQIARRMHTLTHKLPPSLQAFIKNILSRLKWHKRFLKLMGLVTSIGSGVTIYAFFGPSQAFNLLSFLGAEEVVGHILGGLAGGALGSFMGYWTYTVALKDGLYSLNKQFKASLSQMEAINYFPPQELTGKFTDELAVELSSYFNDNKASLVAEQKEGFSWCDSILSINTVATFIAILGNITNAISQTSAARRTMGGTGAFGTIAMFSQLPAYEKLRGQLLFLQYYVKYLLAHPLEISKMSAAVTPPSSSVTVSLQSIAPSFTTPLLSTTSPMVVSQSSSSQTPSRPELPVVTETMHRQVTNSSPSSVLGGMRQTRLTFLSNNLLTATDTSINSSTAPLLPSSTSSSTSSGSGASVSNMSHESGMTYMRLN